MFIKKKWFSLILSSCVVLLLPLSASARNYTHSCGLQDCPDAGLVTIRNNQYYGGNKLHYKSYKKHPESVWKQPSFPSQRASTGNKLFLFDPNQLAWAAYDANGSLVKVGQASGGRGYCDDIHSPCKTPIGTFHVYSKGGADCKSSKFPIGKGGAPMPYCMYFNGGYAIHGSYDMPNYNASHGCIRVMPEAADWLTHNFIDTGTTVIVQPY